VNKIYWKTKTQNISFSVRELYTGSSWTRANAQTWQPFVSHWCAFITFYQLSRRIRCSISCPPSSSGESEIEGQKDLGCRFTGVCGRTTQLMTNLELSNL